MMNIIDNLLNWIDLIKKWVNEKKEGEINDERVD